MFLKQGVVLIKLTTTAAFVTLGLQANTVMLLLRTVVMIHVTLVYPVLKTATIFPAVRAHLVSQETVKIAKVTFKLALKRRLLFCTVKKGSK